MGKLYIGNEYVPFTVKDERRPLQNYDGSEPLCIKIGGSIRNRFTDASITSVDLPFLTELNDPTATEATGLLAKCFDSNTNLVTASFSKLKTINSPYALFQCFYDCTNLTTVSFQSLEVINGHDAFWNIFANCSSLTTISLPKLREINCLLGDDVIAGCTLLETLSFPALTTINHEFAFSSSLYMAENLTTVSFPALTTIIGDSVFDEAFRNDTSLTTVSFPSLQSITGDNIFIDSFDGCESLESLYFPALTHIEGTNDHPFYDFGNSGSLESLHFRADKQAEFEQIMEISVHNLDVYYDL